MADQEQVLRDTYHRAERRRVAVLATLDAHRALFVSLAELLEGCRRDAAMQAHPPGVPREIPSRNDLMDLLSALETAVATKAAMQAALQVTGHPPVD